MDLIKMYGEMYDETFGVSKAAAETSVSSAQAPVENREASQLVGSGSLVGPLAQRHWKAPFRYEAEGAVIMDADGERALDIRSWGRLTGRGGLNLAPEHAEKIQDDFGESVVRILNASWPNTEVCGERSSPVPDHNAGHARSQ
jgi:hypothetical protein